MRIKGGQIFCGDGHFRPLDIEFGTRITAVGISGGRADIDARGKYIIPGLVDIHTHGAAGADASDGDRDGLTRLSLYYAQYGVTSWCPTIMSLPRRQLLKAVRAVRDFSVPGARCVGIHIEGPFLNTAQKGAQKGEYLRSPDFYLFQELMEESGGRIRLLTVAPELPGAMELIRRASELCTVSIGHSAADYGMACRGFSTGASHVTHLFNGMNRFHHREPGIPGAAFDCGATAEIICDGLHVHPAAIRMAGQLFGERLVLISDSMRSAGMADGTYELGGQQVTVRDRTACLADGTLAGSCIHLMDGLQNAVRFGIPFERAVTAATLAPARVIGMEHEIGRLAAGCRADMLILDENRRLEKVIIGGRVME